MFLKSIELQLFKGDFVFFLRDVQFALWTGYRLPWELQYTDRRDNKKNLDVFWE